MTLLQNLHLLRNSQLSASLFCYLIGVLLIYRYQSGDAISAELFSTLILIAIAIKLQAIFLFFLIYSSTLLLRLLFFDFSGTHYDVWLLSVICFMTGLFDAKFTKHYFNLYVVIAVLSLLEIIFIQKSSLLVRQSGIFEGPLALGLFCSSFAVVIFSCVKNIKLSILLFSITFLLVAFSGSRHAALVSSIFLFLYYCRYFFNLRKVHRFFVFLLLLLLLLFLSFPVLTYIGDLDLRSFNAVANSDASRFLLFSNFYEYTSFQTFFTGHGRDFVGSIGVRSHGEAIVLESSYFTMLLSYGVSVFLIFLVYSHRYYLKVFRSKNAINFLAGSLIFVEPFISQRFETPSILLLYMLSTSSFFNYIKQHASHEK